MKFSIIKREPSYFFNNMHEDLTRFLKDTFGDMEFMDKGHMPLEMTFRPAIEVKETPKSYKVKVELSGVKKEDIDVDLYENGIGVTSGKRVLSGVSKARCIIRRCHTVVL